MDRSDERKEEMRTLFDANRYPPEERPRRSST
jgi:hypothetical protein